MQFGFVISVLMHAGILAWALVNIHATPPMAAPEPEAISVAIVTPSEILRMKQGDETVMELEAKAKDQPKTETSKLEAPKPKPPEPAAEPPPPPPPVEAATPEAPPPPPPAKAEPEKKSDPIAEKLAEPPPPPPGPTPDELKKIEEQKQAEEQKKLEEQKKAEEERKAEDQRKAEELKKAEEKKKAEELKKAEEEKRKKIEKQKKLAEAKRKAEEEKKKQFDPSRIAALIDKSPDKRGAPPSGTQPKSPTNYTGPTAGTRDGRDDTLSAREIDILRNQISSQLRPCWKLPGGGGGIETVVVTVRWNLNADGSLDGEPRIEQPQSGPVFQIAAEAALRAVKGCSPFKLPPDKYNAWRMIIWDFDPRQML